MVRTGILFSIVLIRNKGIERFLSKKESGSVADRPAAPIAQEDDLRYDWISKEVYFIREDRGAIMSGDIFHCQIQGCTIVL